MHVVWQKGDVTVRDVYETLLERRRISYTSVMTMMKILEGKRHLNQRRADRAFFYRATRPAPAAIAAVDVPAAAPLRSLAAPRCALVLSKHSIAASRRVWRGDGRAYSSLQAMAALRAPHL
jgi:hypothetical protein